MDGLIISIKYLMKRKGKSQLQISKDIGVSEVQFSKWMNNRAVMGVDKLILIADSLGVKASYLISLGEDG